ncbi:MAG: hypothetical protein ACLQNE_44540 [Thermoguttaceae bacterium]
MRKLPVLLGVFAVVAWQSTALSRTGFAGDLGWLDITHLFQGTHVDVHCPESDKQCGHERCVTRAPVQDCVVGEKKVYKTSIHCEHVAIPETRYKWEWKCIEKEVPAEYCKTVCEPQKVDHCYQSEHWEKQDLGCAEVYCKSCQTKLEKVPCMTCKTEPGKTTVKVHYWSFVRVPYTVYRQVEREICVKQPRYEKVEIPVTRYVACEHCGGKGCEHCLGKICEHCLGKGCEYCRGRSASIATEGDPSTAGDRQ